MADFDPVVLPEQGQASGAPGVWDDVLAAAIRQIEANLNQVKALAEAISGGDLDAAVAALADDEGSETYGRILGIATAVATDTLPSITINSITNAGDTGKALMAAADKAAGRSAIDAQVDTWRPAAADISDAGDFGKTLVQASTQSAAQAALGLTALLASERTIFATVWDQSAGDYDPPIPTDPPSGVRIRMIFGPEPYGGSTWPGVFDVQVGSDGKP